MSNDDKKVVDLHKKAHEILKKNIDTAENVAKGAQNELEEFQKEQLLKRKQLLLERIEDLNNKQSKSEADLIALLNLSHQLDDIDRNLEEFEDFHVGFEPDDDTIEFDMSAEDLAREDEAKTKLENEVMAQHQSLLERLKDDKPNS